MDSSLLVELTSPHVSKVTPYPDIDASAPIEDIIRTFFRHDFVVIRNMLPPAKVKYFKTTYIDPIHKEDDLKIAEGYRSADQQEETELKCGWISDARLRPRTNGGVNLEDAILSPTYIRLADGIMGTSQWKKHGSTNTRRVAIPNHKGGYDSSQGWHIDSMYQEDLHFTLNFWQPLTESGKYSPGLEFILSDINQVKKHAHYNPSIPDQLRTPERTNPRLSREQFFDDAMDQAFDPELRWILELSPGDIALFSGWAPHRTHFPKTCLNERISLENRIFINSPDTPVRANFS